MLGSFLFLDSSSLVSCGASNSLQLGGGEENSIVIFQESQLFTPTDSIANNVIPNIALFSEFPIWLKSFTRSQDQNKIHPQCILYFQYLMIPPKELVALSCLLHSHYFCLDSVSHHLSLLL